MKTLLDYIKEQYGFFNLKVPDGEAATLFFAEPAILAFKAWLQERREEMWKQEQPENRGKFQIDWEYSKLLGELESLTKKADEQ